MKKIILIMAFLCTSLFAWSILWQDTDSKGQTTIRVECNSGTMDGGVIVTSNGGNYCTNSGCLPSLNEAASSLCN